MILINDLHLSVNRVTGTTPQSREDLRTYTFEQFSSLLDNADGHDLCILGDLFDSFEVPARDWLEAYMLLSAWCANNLSNTLILVAGNHDVSLKGNRVSSFETLGTVLDQQLDNVRVVGIDETYLYNDNVYIVAHHRNQELFDLTLAKVLDACDRNDFVLLHANYHNQFAERSDHSLNVSEDVAKEFANKGVTLAFAHEHCGRTEIPYGAKDGCAPVVVLGNQIATSISDWLGSPAKFYHTLANGKIEKHLWQSRDGGYAEVDWRTLEANDTPFIRVVGDAINAEAAAVIDAIHRFRQKSSAFVITNAVKIEGIAEIGDLPSTFSAAAKFDVMDFVYRQLDSAEVEIIRKIAEGLE